jgi:GTP-binding protein Era
VSGTVAERAGFVSLVGRPNSGKSTLLNALVGAKVAIVSDKPQTTRNRITGVKNVPGAGQIVFVDTPGIHRPLHRMNVRMVDSAIDTMREVDVLALVVDASVKPGKGDRFVMDVVKRATIPVVLVLNKIDLIKKPRLLPLIDSYRREHQFAAIVPVSALTGDGVDVLERALLAHLPEGEALYPDDYLTDQPERVMAAELVREKLLAHTRDELPFTTAVVIDQFEQTDKLLRLYATILVDQESHKPIVLGRRGDMIKRIGTEAREELERLFDTKVFLDLHVKVKSDWRDDERLLDELNVPQRRGRR